MVGPGCGEAAVIRWAAGDHRRYHRRWAGEWWTDHLPDAQVVHPWKDMPNQDVLMLAVAMMRGGVWAAGMTAEPDPVTRLRWVRPIRERGRLCPGDITAPAGDVLRPFDVVEFSMLRPAPTPPHTEDWVTDFVQRRPRMVRRLEGQRRAGFLRKHQDSAPRQVLEAQQRSLCLIRPDWVKGCFRLDGSTGSFDARLAFGLDQRTYRGAYARGGHPVTDLRWRALGRAWLPEDGGWTEFEAGDLEARFGITEVYLVVGLTRSYQGGYGLVVAGVHTVPDHEASVDYDNL